MYFHNISYHIILYDSILANCMIPCSSAAGRCGTTSDCSVTRTRGCRPDLSRTFEKHNIFRQSNSTHRKIHARNIHAAWLQAQLCLNVIAILINRNYNKHNDNTNSTNTNNNNNTNTNNNNHTTNTMNDNETTTTTTIIIIISYY